MTILAMNGWRSSMLMSLLLLDRILRRNEACTLTRCGLVLEVTESKPLTRVAQRYRCWLEWHWLSYPGSASASIWRVIRD